MDLKKMRACSPLLPPPGGDVVCECLDEIERLSLMLQMAYCQKVGTDTPHGLDCCDDYRDWLATLTPNVELMGCAHHETLKER